MKLKSFILFIASFLLCFKTFGGALHEKEILGLVDDLKSIRLAKSWRSDPLPTLPLIYFSSNILKEQGLESSISVAYFETSDKKIISFKEKLMGSDNSKKLHRINLKEKGNTQYWFFGKKFSYSIHVVGINQKTNELKSLIYKKVLNHEKSF